MKKDNPNNILPMPEKATELDKKRAEKSLSNLISTLKEVKSYEESKKK